MATSTFLKARNINQAACDLAKGVALEGGALFAGSICQTGTMYTGGAGKEVVQKHFERGIQPFVDNGADFLVAEVCVPSRRTHYRIFC